MKVEEEDDVCPWRCCRAERSKMAETHEFPGGTLKSDEPPSNIHVHLLDNEVEKWTSFREKRRVDFLWTRTR
ncbi:hypothetical protein INR49_011668 [Caranx melampygus]|nr:hypothetical protein INR49_011668 [Caranx melampygus]